MKNLTALICVLLVMLALSPDKELFFVASALLIFLVRYSWRDNEPKIIFIGMIFYWLTACTLLIYGAFFGIKMADLTLTPQTFIYTTYLSLLATFFYCGGMLLAIRKISILKGAELVQELGQYDGKKILVFYIAYSVFCSLFGRIALSLGGLSQVAVGVIWIKWAFLTILIVHTLQFTSNQKYVYLVLTFEIVLSFAGFWSDFKDYLFIAAAAFLTFSRVFTPKRVFFIGFLSVLTFSLMVIWTIVKGEYRQYLTGGQQTFSLQEQSKLKNLEKLVELVNKSFNKADFAASYSKGIFDLSNRISYTEYFALSVAQVPANIPYENGALLMGGFEHVFKPRLFFPDKKSIDDSQITSKYTGRQFAGAAQGASFSLGLVAERYIDYGPVYMFIPIFGFGVLIGLVYKYIISKSINRLWGLAFVSPMFFFIPSLGVPTTKFLGWLFTYFIVWFLFNKYLIKPVDNFLRLAQHTSVDDPKVLTYT